MSRPISRQSLSIPCVRHNVQAGLACWGSEKMDTPGSKMHVCGSRWRKSKNIE